LNNTVIADNEAAGSGSGLYVDSSQIEAIHTTWANNSNGDGRALYIDSKSDVFSSVALTNTIVATHSAGIEVTDGNTVTVNSILWHSAPLPVSQTSGAVVSLQNQTTGDPAFAADDYHLTYGSAPGWNRHHVYHSGRHCLQ
jgi:hypothetical protein